MQLTKPAIKQIKSLASQQDVDDILLRVAVMGGGCSGFTYDMDFTVNPQESDVVLEFDGVRVCVDPMSYGYLENVSIDHVESFQYSGFRFDNPDVKATCGCGTSFSV